VIVVDASAVVAALLRDGRARQRLAHETLNAPHLLDSEVTEVLRRLVRREDLGDDDAERALATWQQIGVSRYPTIGMITRIWELRHNVSAYDAAYIALAERLDCDLITADRRLSGAPGPGCTIEVLTQ
jgi:predicted nucleic acid-binding protein